MPPGEPHSRPAPVAVLQPAQLAAGDVLLCRSKGVLAHLVTLCGAGSYSHAALWTGHSVIEAVPGAGHATSGQVRETSMASCAAHRTAVHVYRWVRAPSEPQALAQVVARARGFVGRSYSIHQALLLAYAHHRDYLKLRFPRQSPDAIRAMKLELVTALRAAEHMTPERSMTCSELVASAFAEAAPEGGCALRFAIDAELAGRADSQVTAGAGAEADGAGPATGAALDAELQALCEQLLARDAAARAPQDAANALTATRSDGPPPQAWPLYMVSPGDLERSEDLRLLGALPTTVAAGMTSLSPGAGGDTGPAAPPTRPAATRARERRRPPERAAALLAPHTSGHRILYAAAAPASKQQVRFDLEFDAIDAATRRTPVQLCKPVLHATVGQLEEALTTQRPAVLHFAGHGSERALVLLNRDGELTRLGAEGLQALLAGRPATLRLVVLAACHTAAIAGELAGHVDHAIGMRGVLTEREAIRFAAELYEGLADGRPVEVAFQRARHELGLRSDLPVLVSAEPCDGAHPEAGQAPARPRVRPLAAGAVAVAAAGLLGAFTLWRPPASAPGPGQPPAADRRSGAPAPAQAPAAAAPTSAPPLVPGPGAQAAEPPAPTPPRQRQARSAPPAPPAPARFSSLAEARRARREGRLSRRAYFEAVARLKRQRRGHDR